MAEPWGLSPNRKLSYPYINKYPPDVCTAEEASSTVRWIRQPIPDVSQPLPSYPAAYSMTVNAAGKYPQPRQQRSAVLDAILERSRLVKQT